MPRTISPASDDHARQAGELMLAGADGCRGGWALAPRQGAAGVPTLATRLVVSGSVFGPMDTKLSGAARDDVLDAYAVLWSVERHQRGEHVVLGDDTDGQAMVIIV